MPTVPVVDQTAMSAQPLAAPGVTPMRNDAPQQLAQSGQALQQAGALATRTGQTIGDRLASQVDEATVKTAEAAALSKANSINYDPQTGFLNQKGQNAIDGYDPATQAVHKAFQEQHDDLSNPIQKQMFQQVMQGHLLSIGQQMAQHSYQQTSQYAGEAAIGRANASAAAASNASSSYGQTDADGNAAAGDYAKNLAVAEQETLKAVGVMKGAPADSDVAKAALLTLHTQIGTGVLSQMMDARAPFSKVQTVFDDLKAKGFLDLRSMDALGRMVKTYTEQESTRAAVNQSLSDAVRASQGQATSATGTPDYQFPIKGATITAQPYDPEHGAVAVNTPQASSIQAPADGKVIQVGKDDNGTFGMQIQHADGSVTTFSGLGASNVKAGDTVQRGEDVATSGAPAVLWSLANKNGQAVDPTRAGLGPVDLTKVTDEKVLSAALDNVRKQVTDPYLQQQATSEMESIVRHNQGMANAEKVQQFSAASDAFYKGGEQWRAIPPTLFNSLTGEQQQHFKDAQTSKVLQDYSQGQQFKEMSSTDIVSDFVTNPDMLTTANVEAARPRLANNTYLSLMRQAQDNQANPDKLMAAKVDMTRLKYFASQSGLPIYGVAARLESNKTQFAELTTSVQDAVNAEQIAKKRQLTQDEKDVIMKQQLTQQKLTTLRNPNNPLAVLPSWLGGSPVGTVESPYTFQLPKNSAGALMPDAAGRAYSIQRLRALGISSPTDDQIGTYYREALKHQAGAGK